MNLHKIAEEQNIPLRTLDQVRTALAQCKNDKARESFARLALRHGRLTGEAVQYVIAYVDHVWQCQAYGIARTDK